MINIVVSRYRKDVSWTDRLNGINRIMIYEKEMPDAEYNIPVNKGNEASVYLKYIIDHYDNLTDFTFFTHDDEYAWHHTGSIVDKFDEAVSSKQLYYNINDKCILGSITEHYWYQDILEWYDTYIEKYIPRKSLPYEDWTVDYRGSAQFLVHRSLIRSLPREFYEGLYNWITTTHLGSNQSGRYLEWTWHIFWSIYPNQI